MTAHPKWWPVESASDELPDVAGKFVRPLRRADISPEDTLVDIPAERADRYGCSGYLGVVDTDDRFAARRSLNWCGRGGRTTPRRGPQVWAAAARERIKELLDAGETDDG